MKKQNTFQKDDLVIFINNSNMLTPIIPNKYGMYTVAQPFVSLMGQTGIFLNEIQPPVVNVENAPAPIPLGYSEYRFVSWESYLWAKNLCKDLEELFTNQTED